MFAKAMSFFVLVTAICISPCFAKTISKADQKAVSDLAERSGHLSVDIGQTTQEIAEQALAKQDYGAETDGSLQCMQLLSGAIDHLTAEFHALDIGTALGEMSVNKFDQQSAVEMVALNLDEAEHVLPHSRNTANQVMGDCPKSAVVTTKAQAVLSIASDMDSLMSALSEKYGHSKHWLGEWK
ncbi:MAG TPA: hypothetical protein VIJ62_04945 [Rhizomicrobium sp.]